MTDLLGKCGLPVWEEEPQGDDVGLVIRNVSAELKSYGGFAWPESGYVEAPDWRDAASPSSKPGELRPIGLALTAIIAGLPVPRDLERQ